MPSRPAEAITGVVGSLLGALVILLDEWAGISISAKALGALVILVSWIAAAVTWYVARKQRDVTEGVTSGKDGTVLD